MVNKSAPVPEWLRRSAIYQINPRTFSREGTLRSIENELPFLRDLGFRTIYLCPVFPADTSEDRNFWSDRQKKYKTENPKNPYRMNGYFGVDDEYGTEDDLRSLISSAHRLGMRVLLDLVYFHIGPNAPILKSHPEFVIHAADGSIEMGDWHFPRLNFDCPGLREYLWCNMIYYIGELDADGFRCDVGDGVPLSFWEEGKRRMLAVKPDSVLLNEGTKPEYLLDAFNACYCFTWHSLIYDILLEKENAAALRRFWEQAFPAFPEGARFLRDIDNHDTVTDWPERAEILAGHEGMELLEVMNYMIDGIPMVYTGNELGDTAHINMFANRFHMGTYETTDRAWLKNQLFSKRRQEIIQYLNKLKAESDLLDFGSTVWLKSDDRVAAFSRSYGDKAVIFAGNLSTDPVIFTIPESSFSMTDLNARCALDNGQLLLEPWGYAVLTKI